MRIKLFPLILILAIGLFLFFELRPSIKMLEGQSDEFCWGSITLEVLSNDVSYPYIYILGRRFPLTDGRHGALESYILLPFILIGGNTLAALRICSILFGVAAIIFLYWLGAKFFNPYVGIMAAFLLACNGTFLYIAKTGVRLGFSLLFFCLASLILLSKYHDTKNNIYFYIAMFFLALGFSAKGIFMWFIVPLCIIGVVSYLPKHRIKIRTLLLGFFSFFIGSVPILFYYLKTDFLNNNILPSLHFTRYDGANNFALWHNILLRLEHLNLSINKRGQLLPIILFWTAFSFLFYKIAFKKKTVLKKERIVFILALSSLIFLNTIFTLSIYDQDHLLILLPFMQLVIAIAIWEVFKSSFDFRMRLFVIIAATSLFLFNLQDDVLTYQQYETENKNIEFCNSELVTDWLLDNKYKFDKILFLEPTIYYAVRFLSDLKIGEESNRFSLWTAKPDKTIENNIYNAVKSSKTNTIFILDYRTYSFNIVNDYFASAAKKLNKDIIVIKEFRTYPSNQIRFRICQVK